MALFRNCVERAVKVACAGKMTWRGSPLDGVSVWGDTSYDGTICVGRFTAGDGKNGGRELFPLEVFLGLYG